MKCTDPNKPRDNKLSPVKTNSGWPKENKDKNGKK